MQQRVQEIVAGLLDFKPCADPVPNLKAFLRKDEDFLGVLLALTNLSPDHSRYRCKGTVPTPTDIHGEKGQASTNVANRAGIAKAGLVRAKGDVHAQPGVAFPVYGFLAAHARNEKA